MHRFEFLRWQWLFLFLFGLLTACGPATPFPTATSTPAAAATPLPKPTATLTPTTTPHPPTPTPSRLAPMLPALEAEVSRLRGFATPPAVQRVQVSPPTLARRVQEARQHDPTLPTTAWQALGLLPREAASPWPAFAPEDGSAWAWFDPQSRTLFFAAPSPAEEDAFRLAYVYAYSRALQPAQAAAPCADLTDACLAARAQAVGDAVFTEYLWFFAAGEPPSPQATTSSTAATPVPPAVTRQQQFPQSAGFRWALMLSQRGQWPLPPTAWEQPPTSTEQILAPARYPHDQPQAVDIPAVDALQHALGPAWRLAGQGDLGVWWLDLMLSAGVTPPSRLPADQALTAVIGWQGGRWVAFRNQDAVPILLAVVQWDTAEDTVAFVKAFVRYARGRYGPLADRAYRRLYWQSAHEAAVLAYDARQRRTVWAFAPNRETAEKLLQAAQAPGFAP